MLVWLLDWRRSIVIVGLIALSLLLGNSSFVPEAKLLGVGWWMQHQQLPQTTSWRTIKRRVKLPGWYLRLQAWYLCLEVMSHTWQSTPKGEYLLRLVCYLLAWSAVGWVWLLRWGISVMMRNENTPLLQGNWGWVGGLANHSATMQVQLQILVVADCGLEAVVSEQVKPLPPQVCLDEAEIGSEESLDEPGMVSHPVWIVPEGSGTEVQGRCLGSAQSGKSGLMLLESPLPVRTIEESRSVDEPSQGNQAKKGLPAPLASLMDHFSELDDPRIERTKKHQLFDIVVITICAVIADADTWVEVADFGRDREPWLRTFLDLPNGIPSHDTFGRVFRHLDPQQWQTCFLSWIQAVNQVTGGQIIPIDGKTLRRSQDKTLGKKAIHMVSAWASENRLVLGQVKVDEKSNEITAIPALLEMLTLAGCIVTIDAMGCQKDIAAKVIDKQAHYLLALKDNQPKLYEAVQALFAQVQQGTLAPHSYHKTEEDNRGRSETRECWTISDPNIIAALPNFSAWTALQSVVMVRAKQQRGDKPMTEDRFYISSLPGQAETILHAVRTHWNIENSLHWVLDIAFAEDQCRIRKGYGAQNFAVLRHLALNLLKQETTVNAGIKAKRKKANRSVDYLLQVLNGFT